MSAAEGGLSVLPDETALSLLRRVRCRPLCTGIAFLDDASTVADSSNSSGGGGGSSGYAYGYGRGVLPGDVIELYGASGSAKSEVLINVVVRCVLPKDLGGEERGAWYFDNDARFSLMRLENLLRERIARSPAYLAGAVQMPRGVSGPPGSPELDPRDPEQRMTLLLLSCMQRLRVVRCASAFELLASIEALHAELEQGAAVVVVDSLGSFLWQERLAACCGGEAVDMQAAAMKALARLTAERPVLLFAAKPALFAQRSTGGGGSFDSIEHREYLPTAWQRAVRYRIELAAQPAGLGPWAVGSGGGGSPYGGYGGGGVTKRLSAFSARVTVPGTASGGAGGGYGGGSRNGGGIGAGQAARVYPFIVTDGGIEVLSPQATC